MRLALVSLLLLLPAVLARAAEAELVRVWPAWRDADSFDRIAEYFGGKESSAGEVFLRTQADARAGYYFLVRVRAVAAQPGAKFELQVIRPDAPEPKVFSFPAVVPARESVFHLGLTGAAWPAGKQANPVAWKITLKGADDRVLAEHHSFLWEKPAK